MKLPKWATTVTPLSKTLALIIFITFPILGFWVGRAYQSSLSIKEKNTTQKENETSLANPASVYCKDQGGESRIITDADGSQRGECVFVGGRSCDEWQFFRTKICAVSPTR
jgi:putative hemolysin